MPNGLAAVGELVDHDVERRRRHARSQSVDRDAALTQRKLDDIGARVDALQALRRELDLLMDSCTGSGKSCPIIDGIEDGLREDAG